MLRTFLNLFRPATQPARKDISPKSRSQEPENLRVDWNSQRLENQIFWARAAILLRYEEKN